mgnify:CR=1 FL=1
MKLSDFTYPEDVKQILEKNKKVIYIDQNIMVVDSATIGSSISTTFTKV